MYWIKASISWWRSIDKELEHLKYKSQGLLAKLVAMLKDTGLWYVLRSAISFRFLPFSFPKKDKMGGDLFLIFSTNS